jgi:hypothetical protein
LLLASRAEGFHHFVDMQQFPPRGPAKDGRKSGRLPLPSPPDKASRLFSTGNRPATEPQPLVRSKRTERGKRIASDVRRALFFAFILVVVGIVLAQFAAVL